MKKDLKVSNKKDNEGYAVKKAFSGHDALDWLMKNTKFTDSEKAKPICQQMLQEQFIGPVHTSPPPSLSTTPTTQHSTPHFL